MGLLMIIAWPILAILLDSGAAWLIGWLIISVCLFLHADKTTISAAFMFMLILGIGSLAGIIFITGLYPDYSVGEQVGYVTKFSQGGLIWRTYEGQLQVGQGAQAALQSAFDFSVKKEKIAKKLLECLDKGKKVKIYYRQWLCSPFHVGSSNYEVLDIREID